MLKWTKPWRAVLPLVLAAGVGAPLVACSASSASAAVSRTGYITIAGGVKLAYDLTLPGRSGRFPVALEYNHYSVGADNGAQVAGSDAGMLLAAGFAVLGVNQPGSGCSGGVNDITDVSEWGRAGAQAVEWAADQPWSTGHVGMFGSSWSGISQIGIAEFHPKGLDAIAPFHIATDFYRDVAYPGGVYDGAFVNYYARYLVQIDAQTARPAISRGDQQCAADFREHVAANRPVSLAAGALAHPADDSYWQTNPAEYISRVNIPVLGCQSWQDGLVSSRATELYYDAFNRRTSWFIGLNGEHGVCDFTQPLTMMVNFLRHYVAGASNGWQQTPHITILHEVSETPTSAPAPSWTSTYRSWSQVMKPKTLYFAGNETLSASPASSETSGTAEFSGPAPSQSGRWTAAPRPGTSVSYTSPPLSRDVDVFGPGSVNLWLSSTISDPGIEVIISEVRPDGMDQYVQAGWLNVAQRALAPAGNGPDQSGELRPYHLDTLASRQPLTPGPPVYARVELMPFEHVFRKGSSIRITIDSASGAVQSTGLWGLTGPAEPFLDTIDASPSRPSQIVLGIIPGATARAPMPACGDVDGEPCRRSDTPVPGGRLTI